ncbi:type II toxin-antitoxin system Phd/YefM family antitoxin [Streptomyces syringium]|uniref:Antitoxin (DNA-binding transcriptional repressor) of toxin-antitoxin stability system n=1 Tax=Streptomyces syringium TaxID=76729 RepID=A0ABS4Y7V2_9ACTN|nr:type II toxin-antitoxin system Phd/YefM family antitoxin [Streptomyces syringium]MBP2404502.1 antitoxin (DNA-binding transcriptional repressor) of toxin-antitoxin stability system [Streptomyces syringium]SPE57438.1 Antitoxin of toxin-antitoxin stability system [Streptomyces netropsis]
MTKVSLSEARIVTMRELSQRTSQVVQEICQSGQPALITRHGKFLAAIAPLEDVTIDAAIQSIAGRAPLPDDDGSRTLLDPDTARRHLGLTP